MNNRIRRKNPESQKFHDVCHTRWVSPFKPTCQEQIQEVSSGYPSRKRDWKTAMIDEVPVTRGWKHELAIKTPRACKADAHVRSSFHRLLMRRAERCPPLLAAQRPFLRTEKIPF